MAINNKLREQVEKVQHLLENPDTQSLDKFLDDDSVVFWVDWREHEEDIIEYCESMINTGTLKAEFLPSPYQKFARLESLFIIYGDQKVEIPLTETPIDRHITLILLNSILMLDYEIRLCSASSGGDGYGFVVLPTSTWGHLERIYGDLVEKAFSKIEPSNILFGQ